MMENLFEKLFADFRAKTDGPRPRNQEEVDCVESFVDDIREWFKNNPPVGVTPGDAGSGLTLRFADGSSYSLFDTKEDPAQFQSVSVVGSVGNSRLPNGKSIPITR
jgi:hypothetical protein